MRQLNGSEELCLIEILGGPVDRLVCTFLPLGSGAGGAPGWFQEPVMVPRRLHPSETEIKQGHFRAKC